METCAPKLFCHRALPLSTRSNTGFFDGAFKGSKEICELGLELVLKNFWLH